MSFSSLFYSFTFYFLNSFSCPSSSIKYSVFCGHYLLITNWSLLLAFVCEINTGDLTIIAGSIAGSPITDQQGRQPDGGLWLALTAHLANVMSEPSSCVGHLAGFTAASFAGSVLWLRCWPLLALLMQVSASLEPGICSCIHLILVLIFLSCL